MTKPLINHHIHSTGSDGKCKPLEIAELAVQKGLGFICFTDHNVRNYARPWGEAFFSKEYVKEIKEVQKKFKGKLEIAFGIEIDWTEDNQKIFKKQIDEFKFDYVLGSVHIIKNSEGEYFGVNFDKDTFIKNKNKTSIEKIVKDYYHQVRLAANSGLFDCVAHFDVIKTLNKDNEFFNENDAFYRKEVLKTLDEIKKNNLCMEINTSGLIYPCKAMFPSQWILKEAYERKIPITIGADTHWAERVDAGLVEAYEMARSVGYKEILKFEQRKSTKIKI